MRPIASLAFMFAMTASLIAASDTCLAADTAELIRVDLGGRWEVTREGTAETIPATVPGCIHTDLLAAKKIPDPFYRENERKVQWIGEANWIYRRSFEVTEALLAREHILLRCEGLDTLATIRVNGQVVGKTDNMFRRYEFDLKDLEFDAKNVLKKGANEIEVRFDSVLPFIRAKEKERKLPTWNYPGSSYVRKEPCNFGWDWGPTLITCGIWRPISLVAFNTSRILDVAITQDHSLKGKVKLGIHTRLDVIDTRRTFSRGHWMISPTEVELYLGRSLLAHREDGKEIIIDDPKLWWPAGMGEQPLYTVKVTIKDIYTDSKGQVQRPILDTVTKRIGLRTLRAVEQTKDTPMHFEVNGVPFFAKGANFIPADSFAPRVTKETLRRYVDDAVACNMNCLRLWGGGYYEDDALLDACDERGICLWVDMKFACTTYPAFDPAFIENIRYEAAGNIIRIRHHPSIALWCGNNEIMFFRGGKEWTADKMSEADYYKLFRDTLGDAVKKLAPETDYVTGSPDCGDVHFWEVWHGGKPFEAYHDIHGFMSEFGFQAFADPKTVAAFTDESDRKSIYSRGMKHHERSNRGYLDVSEDGTIGTDKIMLGVRKYFREPKDFESTLWLSQITQAYGIQLGAEGWRREMPRSMGCVFWQYNDCWPCTSWSSVDYFGRWKALQYAAKRFYSPILVSGVADAKKGTVDVYETSDRMDDANGILSVAITSLDGKSLGYNFTDATRSTIIDFASGKVTIPARSSRKVFKITTAEIDKKYKPRDMLVWLKLDVDGKTQSKNLVTFAYPRDLTLLDPEIKADVTEQGDDFKVTLTAAYPALYTWLAFDSFDARCSDNFVHVRPDEPVEITVHPPSGTTRESFIKAMKVRSLYDTYAH
jgi:beta-mannosidase